MVLPFFPKFVTRMRANIHSPRAVRPHGYFNARRRARANNFQFSKRMVDEDFNARWRRKLSRYPFSPSASA